MSQTPGSGWGLTLTGLARETIPRSILVPKREICLKEVTLIAA